MIITIAGKAGENGDTAMYNTQILSVKSGQYLNSLDVVIQTNETRIVLIGTEEAVALQKNIFSSKLKQMPDRFEFHTFESAKSDDVFMLISKILENVSEDVIIDITHGYRDHSIVASYAAMVSSFMRDDKIELIYAKMQKKDTYIFEKLNAYMDLTEYTFYLRLFYHTCSIGHYRGNDLLLRAMNQFGEDFLANNIQKLIHESYPALKKSLTDAKEIQQFMPLYSLVEKIIDNLSFLDQYPMLKGSKKYLVLARFAESMNYSIIALTYLHESLSLYLNECFEKVLLTTKRQCGSSYQKTQDIRAIIKKEENVFDHAFFKILDEIRDMRNNLAHLSSEYNNRKVMLLKIYISKVEQYYDSEEILTIEIPQRLDIVKLDNQKKKIDEIEKELWGYLQQSSISKNVPFKNLAPELLQSPIIPSPNIPKSAVNALNKLTENKIFQQKLKEYITLLQEVSP